MTTRNQHPRSNTVEVWDSFEWLFRQKLEQLDFMTRQMMYEMSYKGCDHEAIARFVQERFARLWEQVAAEQEEETPERRRG